MAGRTSRILFMTCRCHPLLDPGKPTKPANFEHFCILVAFLIFNSLASCFHKPLAIPDKFLKSAFDSEIQVISLISVSKHLLEGSELVKNVKNTLLIISSSTQESTLFVFDLFPDMHGIVVQEV